MLHLILLIMLTFTQTTFTMEKILIKCEQQKVGNLLSKDSFSIKDLSDDEHIDLMIHYAKKDDLPMFEYVIDNSTSLHYENMRDIIDHFNYFSRYKLSCKEIFELYKGKTVTQEKFLSAITKFGRKHINTPTRFCIKQNIDLLNIKDKEGNTPLHFAAGYYYDKWLVDFILNQPDIDVNAQNNYRRTPLHNACDYNHHDIVTDLLKQPNIDPTIADKDGNTPLHRAYIRWHLNGHESSHYKIIEALEQYSKILKTIKNNIQEIPSEFFCRKCKEKARFQDIPYNHDKK